MVVSVVMFAFLHKFLYEGLSQPSACSRNVARAVCGACVRGMSDMMMGFARLHSYYKHMPSNSCILFNYTDVNDLHKFVTVALHTASGEGAFAHDKLSRLNIAGSGYAPLIYDLQKTPTFECFQDCCKKVWEVLEHSLQESQEGTTSLAMSLVSWKMLLYCILLLLVILHKKK